MLRAQRVPPGPSSHGTGSARSRLRTHGSNYNAAGSIGVGIGFTPLSAWGLWRRAQRFAIRKHSRLSWKRRLPLRRRKGYIDTRGSRVFPDAQSQYWASVSRWGRGSHQAHGVSDSNRRYGAKSLVFLRPQIRAICLAVVCRGNVGRRVVVRQRKRFHPECVPWTVQEILHRSCPLVLSPQHRGWRAEVLGCEVRTRCCGRDIRVFAGSPTMAPFPRARKHRFPFVARSGGLGGGRQVSLLTDRRVVLVVELKRRRTMVRRRDSSIRVHHCEFGGIDGRA